MTEWLISVFSTVLIVSLLTLILPEGKLSKFVKPFISLVVIIIVVSPIIEFNGFSEDFVKSDNAVIKADSDFLGYIVRSKIDLYTKNCIKIAEKNGINGCDVIIEYSVADNNDINVSGVYVNLKNAVISSDDEHIVILQRTRNEIKDYFGVDLSKVKIDE